MKLVSEAECVVKAAQEREQRAKWCTRMLHATASSCPPRPHTHTLLLSSILLSSMYLDAGLLRFAADKIGVFFRHLFVAEADSFQLI